METFEDALRRVHESHQQLKSALKSKFDGATANEAVSLSSSFASFRAACESALRLDFIRGRNEGVESLLWSAHTATNDRFRTLLRKINRKKEAVRWRTRTEEYKRFIKESQIAYRRYIRDLSNHGSIDFLRDIARAWKQEEANETFTSPTNDSPEHRAEFQRLVDDSCHEGLMRLGDLSRWRYVERVDGDRRQPKDAIGYYELAEELIPESGAPQHQLAVLEAGDKHAFRAIYHFYRSLACRDPHPFAQKNLDLELKKVGMQSDEALIQSCMPSDRHLSIAHLRTWFIRFVAGCYPPVDLSLHDELEIEIVSRIVAGLKENDNYIPTIEKMLLISMSGEWQAKNKKTVARPIPSETTYLRFLRFNIRTLLALLQQMDLALDESFREDLNVANTSQEVQDVDRLTRFAQRGLKILHICCFWLAVRCEDLRNVSDGSIAIAVQDTWRTFATVLNRLVEQFQVSRLEVLSYLLSEEELCIGFEPVKSQHTEESWYVEGRPKARGSHAKNDNSKAQQGTEEQLARIRDIVTIGVRLAYHEDSCPIQLDGVRFVYQDPAIPAELLPAQSGHENNTGSATADTTTAADTATTAGAQVPQVPQLDLSQPRQTTLSDQYEGTINLREMVAQLTDDVADPSDAMPQTPLASNFDDVAISESLRPLSVDGSQNASYSSPNSAQPPPGYGQGRDDLPSPALPSFSQFSAMPGFVGMDAAWQARPTSQPIFPDAGAAVWPSHAHPGVGQESQRPTYANRKDVWGHAHHSSFPGNTVSGHPTAPQVSTATTQHSSSLSGFNYAVHTPSPTLDKGNFSFAYAHGPPMGFQNANLMAMARDWTSSSHVFDSSSRSRPNSRVDNPWNVTPPNGQGG